MKHKPWIVHISRMGSQAASRWHVLLCALLLATNSGCATFTSTQRLDLEPFADGTIAVTSDIRYQMAGIASVYIRQHIRGPEVQNAETLAGEIRICIQNIVYYSVQLSEIGRIDVEPQHQGDLALAEQILEILPRADHLTDARVEDADPGEAACPAIHDRAGEARRIRVEGRVDADHGPVEGENAGVAPDGRDRDL